jgi:pyrimidine operon attenuation protein/uracil phosphoribosyltransferase
MTTDTPTESGAAGAPRPPGARVILDDTGVRRALMRIAHEIFERNSHVDELYLVAIPNGGVPLARLLARNLRQIADAEPIVGILDTTLYRDDLATTSERPMLRVTEMPSAVDDRTVVLVDDVVKSGRTIRAAMDALMDFGRPKIVQVVGLVDRGHRELPIKLDYVGKNVPTNSDEVVQLRGNDGDPDSQLEVVVLEVPPEAAAAGKGSAS